MSDQTPNVEPTPAVEPQGQVEGQIEMIGNLEVPSVNEALSSHYGEGFTLEKIEKLRGLQGEYDKLKSDYDAAKVQYERGRFTSPLSERIDTMLRNKAEVPEIMKFLTVQGLNIDEMEPDRLIKQKKSFERPGWSAQDIDDWFQSEYPPLDEDADDFEKRTRSIKIKDQSESAKEYLKQQLVASENPEAEKLKQEQEQKAIKLREDYGIKAKSLMKQISSIPYSVEGNGFKYDFEFNVPEDSPTFEKVAQAVVEQAVQEGVPFDERGDQKIKGMVDQLYKHLYHDEIIKAIVSDAYASLTKKVVTAQSNSAPVATGSGHSQQPPAKERKKVHKKGGRTFV